ncbi:MAG: glycosyltransferase family 2 protein [bacterium]|nr:glycosyltransferase family 2 protein [bacterium]
MDLSIIIVNWNVESLLYRCLKSIFVFTQGIDFEVIVIDNNSTDGSVQMLNELSFEHRNLRIFFNAKNIGFAKANNQGLRAAQGKYALFMNPDMEVTENTAKKLFQYMEAHPDVGASTCQLQYSDGHRQPNVKRNPTFFSQLWLLYKLHHFWQPKFFRNYLAKDFDYSQEQAVEQIMGAFIFARRELMTQIGGWSEDYFVWWEDLDLCKRLQQINEKIVYLPISRVLHYEGKSFLQQKSLKRQTNFNRSMLTYFRKYHRWPAWLFLKFASFDSYILSAVTQIFKIQPKTQSKL